MCMTFTRLILTDFYSSTFVSFINRLSLLHEACFGANGIGSKSPRLKWEHIHKHTRLNPGADIIPQNITANGLSQWGLFFEDGCQQKTGDEGFVVQAVAGGQRGGHRLGTVQGLLSLTSFFMNFKEQRGRQSAGVLFKYVSVSLHRGPGEIRLSNHAKHNFQFN